MQNPDATVLLEICQRHHWYRHASCMKRTFHLETPLQLRRHLPREGSLHFRFKVGPCRSLRRFDPVDGVACHQGILRGKLQFHMR